MALNSKTTIGLTVGEIISIVTTACIAVGFYWSINVRLTSIELRQQQYQTFIDEQKTLNSKVGDSVDDIKQSLIRIEGKLDLKQDRFEN